MAWRIVEKAGLPGWAGLGAILLTLTGIGSIVPLVLLWVFAFMRWPRDEPAGVRAGLARRRPAGLPGRHRPRALPPPPAALADRRAWRLTAACAGGSVALAVDGSAAGLCPDRRARRAGRPSSRCPIRRSASRMPGC